MLKLASEPVPIAVAHRRSGVTEVSISPSFTDACGVEEARVPMSALVERDALHARRLPGLVSRGPNVARGERRLAGGPEHEVVAVALGVTNVIGQHQPEQLGD